MATVTPNFNWPVPTSTDLVKDGATAIEALGDSIDASLVDLKGGTTGQVLSKTSATDMDFTWVTSDDANAIQNTIVDAKGDLIAASAADTPARLAVGNNGETLVADSAATTGLRYSATPSASNPVLNSAMQIWQRGTSIATGTGFTYGADRWQSYRGALAAGMTVSRQVTGDTTNLPSIQYCARVQRDSGNTGTQGMNFYQSWETINSIPFVGKTVTLSFYARAGANFSPAGSALYSGLYYGTGTDQNYGSSYTGTTQVFNQANTLTTTWQRFTVTGTVATAATELSIVFQSTPVGTASTNDYAEITGVQIDIGSVALPFRTNGGTIQGELAACQRYYYRQTATTNAYMDFSTCGTASASTQVKVQVPLPVQMRVTPTSIDFSNLGVNDGATTTALSGLSFSEASPNFGAIATSGATGLTQYRPYFIRANNNVAAFLGFSAEL